MFSSLHYSFTFLICFLGFQSNVQISRNELCNHHSHIFLKDSVHYSPIFFKDPVLMDLWCFSNGENGESALVLEGMGENIKENGKKI